jgi:hypothetical protein
MMTNNQTSWQELCVQLYAALEAHGTTWDDEVLLDRVGVALRLAQTEPEPKEPTDQELRRRFLTWWREEGSAMRPHPDHDHEEHARRISEIAWANGAYVARWGRPSIEPVPVSERPWEREGWCDGDGWCWWFDADGSDPCWVFDQPQFVIWTHCLPAHALPLPVPTQHS